MSDEIERNPNDAVILSYSQNPVEYQSVPKVWLTHPDSTEEKPILVPFTYGEAVDKEVVPDFANGDMAVDIPAGELVTELTVKKPEELTPENIPLGKYIAGVGPGTYVGGSGGEADNFIYYMSIDGDKVLYRKPIMYGDTAGDVIALGLMDEPVIPDTDETKYTFLGWSDTIGGEVKTSMFESVTEDQTVYAVYYIQTKLGSGDCGEAAKWELWDDGQMIVYGEGAMDDYPTETDRPWYDYLSEIRSVEIEDGITHVGQRSFQSCANLETVRIAESVTTLGSHIFIYCSSLADVNIPNGVTIIPMSLFHTCSVLRSVALHDGILEIGNHAFRASGLTSITIPDSVTRIGDYMCYQCAALTNVVIGNGVTYIGLYAFHSCTALSSVLMGNSVQTINYRAFQGCSLLDSITIPASCTTIGDNVFYLTNLESAIFENPYGWYRYSSSTATAGTPIGSNYIGTKSTAARYLRSTYVAYWWRLG